MQLKEYVSLSSRKLVAAAVSDSARFDVELLVCNVLQCERSFLFAWPETELTPNQLASLDELLSRRLAGEPIAYILKQREFWSLPLYVDERVLIPRPDTESLVERILELPLATQATLVDLGTGSGAMVLALASERPDWHCVGVDYSAGATEVARSNIRNLGLSSNTSLLRGDWLQALAGNCVDVIVSNPPYIDIADEHLQCSDVRFEPRSALVSAANGLADIASIVEQSRRVLGPGGFLMVEHGWQQQTDVIAIFEAGGFVQVEAGADSAARPRFVLARLPG